MINNYYRAHFDTGTVDFPAKNLGDARYKAEALGTQHFPGERVLDVNVVMVPAPKPTRKRVRIAR